MLSVHRRLGGGIPAVAIVLIGVLAAACGAGAALGPAGAPASTAAPAAPLPAASAGSLTGEGTSRGGSGDSGNGSGEPAPAEPGLLIIKTGTLILQVTGLDSAVNGATEKISSLGGYAGGSDRSGDGESAHATITFRIPAARWDEALAALRTMADKVLSERSSTDDVTGQVVDLGARIKNLEATERALQAIMDRAVEIKDVLTVQAELTKVRGEIEEMAGQKSHLEQQAAMSTLTVTFELKANPVLAETKGFDPASEAEQASASLVSVLQGVATAGIWFVIVWLPILLFFGIVGFAAFVLVRRLRGASPGSGPPAPEPESAA